MEKIFFKTKFSFFFFLTVILFTSCLKDKITHTYQIRTPVFETLTKFRQSIKSGAAATIAGTGKIVVAGKYIFLSETGKGIHVIDNSNPAQPKNISFINVPGNEDLAIDGNTLYADAYADLVSFDITDPANAVAKNFAVNVFPDHSTYYNGVYTNPDSINVIVDWIVRDTTVDYVANAGGGIYLYPGGCSNCTTIAANMTPSSSNTNNTTGTTGSLSKFAILNNFLYTVYYSNIASFDISNRFSPAFKNTVNAGWSVETIYPFEGKLFVGGTNGMYIYDVSSSPEMPTAVGEFAHARTCDPVIADGDYAYVTLHDGTQCQGFSNELDVVDIKNVGNSTLVKTYQLTHPMGLSKDGNNLFVCDGTDGLKVFDASDVNNLKLIKHLKGANVNDVIVANGLAIVMATDGIYQYDYSDLNNIHLLSKL